MKIRTSLALAAFAVGSSALAEITTDGTIGGGGSGQLIPSGNGFTYDITEDLGQRIDSNLFHSFDQFSLLVGESANFSGDPTIQHIIGRITGGVPSTLDGTLSSSIVGADVWLVNPAGLLLGPNAVLNVPGAVHLSTGESVQLSDQTEFTAALTAPPVTLTSSAPVAFGFVGQSPTGVEITGSTLQADTLTFSGGSITVTGADVTAGGIELAAGPFEAMTYTPLSGAQEATGDLAVSASTLTSLPGTDLVIQGGQITLAGVALRDESFGDTSPDIEIAGEDVVINDFFAQRLTTSAEPSGDIVVNAARTLDITNATLRTDSSGFGPTGSINLAGADSVDLTFTLVLTDSFFGNAGGINITGGDVLLSTGTVVTSSADLDGAPIGIAGTSVTLADLAGIRSETNDGQGAPIVIAGGLLDFDGTSNALTTMANGFGGRGGDIIITGGEFLAGADRISTLTTFGIAGNIFVLADAIDWQGTFAIAGSVLFGDLGNIIIQASQLDVTDGFISTDNASIQGGDIAIGAARAGFSNTTVAAVGRSFGNAGNVSLDVGDLRLSDFSSVSSRSQGFGLGGNIDVITTNLLVESQSTIGVDALDIESLGTIGDISINTSTGTVTGSSFITSSTASFVDAGDITVLADEIVFTDNSAILALSLSTGAGGAIDVNASSLTLEGSSNFSADALGSGRGGSVSVLADDVSISSSLISARTLGEGDGGDVSVNTSSLTMIDSDVSATTFHLGDAGDVTILVDDASLSDNSGILADTLGGGDAGDILVRGGSIVLDGRSFLTSTTSLINCSFCVGTDGTGGTVTAEFNDLTLLGSSVITSQTTTAGAGGDILLRGTTLLSDGGEIASNTLSTGDAGSIDIALVGGEFRATGGIVNSASSLSSDDAGSAGSVSISAHTTILGGAEVTVRTSSSNTANSVGQINLSADIDLVVTDGALVSATSAGAVAGGEVGIRSPRVIINNGATISTDATGLGDSGAVDIVADSLIDVSDAIVRTNASQSAGGDITLTTTGSTIALDTASLEASAGADGTGGNITLNTDNLILQSSGILAEADAGNGGQIDINSTLVLQGFESLISADSNTGNAGTISIAAPNDDVSAAVAPQNENVLSTPRIPEGPCAPARVQAGSIVLAGSGGSARWAEDAALAHYPPPSRETLAQASALDSRVSVMPPLSITCGYAAQ